MHLPYKMRQKEYKQSFIPHLSGVRFYLDTWLENLLFCLTPMPKYGLRTAPGKETITVSLTTYPARINQAYVAIKSLMCQSIKADKIVLWLAESQFTTAPLPAKFGRLIKRGLTVRYVDDLKSHKKYYYALQEQKPDELVITYDDDIIYEKDSIKKLIRTHEKYPDCIVCNRGHKIEFDEFGIKPYKYWKVRFGEGAEQPAMNIMPSTGNGCLYPYGVIPQSAFDLNLCKQNAWTADDIWMRFNSINNGVFVVRTQKEVAVLVNVFPEVERKIAQLYCEQ